MSHGTTDSQPPWWNDVESDPVHGAAVEWLLRLQDRNVSLEDTLAWQKWMKESAKHARAFARLEEISQAMRGVRPPQGVSAQHLANDRYEASVPLGAWRPEQPRFRRTFALAMAASAVLVAVGLGAWLVGARGIGADDFRFGAAGTVLVTAVGENRTVSLRDGSKVTLGGDTRLAVHLRSDSRSIVLSRGEAFFVVAKDPIRPFKVHAGNATVTAVGTQFNVRRASDRAVVVVTEGRVVVEPVTRLVPVALLRELKPMLRPVHLTAGQQTTAGSAGIEAASKVEDPSATTLWETGRLAFRLQPLKYVLEDVNRYAPKPIEIEDERIGSLLITGTVTGGNVEGWIGSLERAFGLEAVEGPNRILLRKR